MGHLCSGRGFAIPVSALGLVCLVSCTAPSGKIETKESPATRDSTATDDTENLGETEAPDTDTDTGPGNGDADGDGILDRYEGRNRSGGPTDTDGDGIPDYLDGDSDNDGIPDADEGQPTSSDGKPPDTDGDGIPDFRDTDSDGDSIPDEWESRLDLDGDGLVEWRDPVSDAATPTLTLVPISTAFNSPIGIDFHEPTASVVMSVNYSSGIPHNFERVLLDGSHVQFSTFSGLTNEVKIATARPGNRAGFASGTFFVGNGVDGQVVRISPDGATIDNPWVDLPGDGNGLMRGSLYVDQTGLYGDELVVATTTGQVWRIDVNGAPTQIADLGVHLEGVITVPDAPARYGPLAGRILSGAENEGFLHAIAGDGTWDSYDFGVKVEDIDRIMPFENFFGVNYGSGRLLGASARDFAAIVGDLLLTQESPASSALYRLWWNGTDLVVEEFPLSGTSAIPAQWEHVTFAAAGIQEVPHEEDRR